MDLTKTFRPLILLSFFFLSHIVGKVQAQQNLFNVPSSDITPKAKPFFQQQFNIGEGLVQLNSTFSYGLGRGAEIGFNVTALTINGGAGKSFLSTNGNIQSPPVYPFYTINFQKAFTLSSIFKFAIGAQAGLGEGANFGMYDYMNLITVLPKHKSKIITGVYYGTDSFLGSEDRTLLIDGYTPFGFQIGLEQPIIERKLLLILENISGLHNLGETTIGCAFYLTDQWVLSSGFQFSNPGSKTPEALVIEFTFVPGNERIPIKSQ